MGGLYETDKLNVITKDGKLIPVSTLRVNSSAA